MPRLVVICLLFYTYANPVYAQQKVGQSRIDSLLTGLAHTRPDTNRVNLLNTISREYWIVNPNQGITYANQALALASQLKWKTGIMKAYNRLGGNYLAKSDYPKALTNYLSGLKIAEEIKNKIHIAGLSSNIGVVYASLSNYPKAIDYFEKLLKVSKELGNKTGIAESLSNIGEAFRLLGNYSKAVAYLQESLTVSEEIGLQRMVGNASTNLARAYLNLANYPKAFTYMGKGLRINKAMGNKLGMADIYNGLSTLYLQFATDSNATALKKLMPGNKTEALQKARTYADSGRGLAREIGDLDHLYQAYQTLSSIEELLGHHQNALAYFRQYSATKDSIFNQENDKKIAVATLQYDFDKKETALKYEQQLTAAQLQKQTLLTKQQAQELTLKVQAAQIANKERDLQRLQYLQEKAQKQDREKQLALSEKEKSLKASALELSQAEIQRKNQERTYLLAGFGLLATLLGFIVYGYFQEQKAKNLLQRQKEEINQKSIQLENSLTDLRTTQTQLIQREKMASLGELTAGIAHEIQNPLNFVNNFSEVSAELVAELEEEQHKEKRDTELESELLGDLKQNLLKITQHGSRVSAIVRGMLEHSRNNTGEKRPTDLNALANEYLKIAYQSLRAKYKDFDAQLVTDFSPNLAKVEVVPQELGRVLLNLYNNAFYAVQQKQQTAPVAYQPTVAIHTQQINGCVEIRVSDNGAGIPHSLKTKIFQPFFTTKPTGEGTGLGLSLSYDIVTKGHQGSLWVESQEDEGSAFIIQLPQK